MSCKRAARVATALLGVSVLALTAGGRAEASWWWRPAADEADITLVSGGRSVQPALPAEEPSLLDSAQALLGQAADAGVSAAGAAASALAEVPGLLAVPVGAVGSRARSAADTIGQFAWEVAYALGTNSTPVTAIPITEPYDPPEPAAAGTRTVLRSERRDPPPAQKPVRPQPKRPELATTAAGPLALSAAAVETAQGGASAGGLPPIQIAALPSGSDAGAMQSDAADPPVSRPLASAAKAAKPPAPAAEPAAEEEGPIDPKLLANFVYDRAQRRPDGSYFVPKPLQRLFELRTQAVEQGEAALSVKIPGRIVPDPNAHGDVEASLTGRIEAPKGGLPVLGEEVKQGQILGYVSPAVGVVDRTQVRREVARLTTEIRQTAESVELLKQFWFVPFRDGKVIQAEMKLEGLRRERAALLPMLQTQEVLRASTDGVVSVSNAINGRIVQPGEKIFEIVNPKRLWVEAVAADPHLAAVAAEVEEAVATTPDGQALDVSFVGSGLSLQQQAVPLMFRVEDPAEGLRVGRPVTVSIRSKQKSRPGIAVPRDAVVTGSNGLEQVWEHVAPEVFVPRTVTTEAIDGRTVLVTAGLPSGARIVTRGTRLLVQLQ